MKRLIGFLFVLGAVGMLSVSAIAQVKKGKTRLLTTKQLMGGLVKPHATAIGDGLKTAPADDKAWAELATKVALLNEASYTMMDDGRCPDDVWANACKALREGTATALAKIEAKDLAGAQDAMKAASASCGTCHKAHKK
jgi:cytochrome c556